MICRSDARCFPLEFQRPRVCRGDNSEYPAALKAACMKNGKPRNEVEIDAEYMALNEVSISKQIETFEGFKELVDAGYIVVKRFASRTLTAEEQVEAGSNYKTETKEENILRPFEELSAHSQDENLKAAVIESSEI